MKAYHVKLTISEKCVDFYMLARNIADCITRIEEFYNTDIEYMNIKQVKQGDKS